MFIKNEIYQNVKFEEKTSNHMHGMSLQTYLRSFYFRETFYDQAPEMLRAVWVVVTLHITLIQIMYGIAG